MLIQILPPNQLEDFGGRVADISGFWFPTWGISVAVHRTSSSLLYFHLPRCAPFLLPLDAVYRLAIRLTSPSRPTKMGKLTSTIGIPIKLLNEAQVSTAPDLAAQLHRESNANRYRAMLSRSNSHRVKCIAASFWKV
jgi:hypothetical protein